MVEHSPTFIPPSAFHQKIWRYIDFTKFVDLLNTSSLYFTRADFFEDVFEGSTTKATIEDRRLHILQQIKGKPPTGLEEMLQWSGKEAKKITAIDCWHMNDHESAAMWKLYVKSNEGVAIQSTYSRLYESLNNTDIVAHIGTVKYVDYEKDFIPFDTISAAFLHKRMSFKHETELRCIIFESTYKNSGRVNLESGGVKVQLSLEILIEKIFVSPDSPVWFTNLVSDITRKFNLSVPIINSRLNDTPLY